MNFNSIELSGISNAREPGGCRIGGREVKKGLLIRTASLCDATDDAIKKLSDTYRVQTVIDLRMSSEHQFRPDPEIPGASSFHLPVLEMEDMIKDVDPELVKEYASLKEDRMMLFEKVYEAGILDSSMYVFFLLGERGKASWRRFFEELLKVGEDRAFLWHCTDGKDRTGCGSMLILSALGADRELIMADYMHTNTIRKQQLDAVRMKTAHLGWPQEKVDTLIFMSGGVVESYMSNALNALEEKYGSVAGYLREELGIGDAETEILRSRYLV